MTALTILFLTEPSCQVKHYLVKSLRKSPLLLIYPEVIRLLPVLLPRPRTLLWLDVDGVINVLRWHLDEFRTEFPDFVQTTCASGQKEWPIIYSPTLVRCINTWSRVAEIRWLTSWQHCARYRLAPLLGLFDFEVCLFSKFGAHRVCHHTPADLERPLVWIDDTDINHEVPRLWKNPNVLLVAPLGHLSRDNVQQVDRFLATQG